jgi:hypothetical protein
MFNAIFAKIPMVFEIVKQMSNRSLSPRCGGGAQYPIPQTLASVSCRPVGEQRPGSVTYNGKISLASSRRQLIDRRTTPI